MTKQENKEIAVIGNDVKWIKEEMGSMNEHLKTLNSASIKAMNRLIEHEQKISNNHSNINRVWMVILIVLSALFALKFKGLL